MQEIVRRHFWKVTIIVLVILAALWFAPRLVPPHHEPWPPAASGTPGEPRKTSSQEDSPGNKQLVATHLEKPAEPVSPPKVLLRERGKASFYGGSFNGQRTASGEIYNENSLTAAHRTLRMGTKVNVKNLRNGREVVVRINNRGPHIRGRIIDVSTRAARELRMVDAGVVPVEITVLERPQPKPLAKN